MVVAGALSAGVFTALVDQHPTEKPEPEISITLRLTSLCVIGCSNTISGEGVSFSRWLLYSLGLKR